MKRTAGNVVKVRTVKHGKRNGFQFVIDHVKVGKADRFRLEVGGWVTGYFSSPENALKQVAKI